MGHDLPSPLWPTMVAAVTRHAERAERAPRDWLARSDRGDARMAP